MRARTLLESRARAPRAPAARRTRACAPLARGAPPVAWRTTTTTTTTHYPCPVACLDRMISPTPHRDGCRLLGSARLGLATVTARWRSDARSGRRRGPSRALAMRQSLARLRAGGIARVTTDRRDGRCASARRGRGRGRGRGRRRVSPVASARPTASTRRRTRRRRVRRRERSAARAPPRPARRRAGGRTGAPPQPEVRPSDPALERRLDAVSPRHDPLDAALVADPPPRAAEIARINKELARAERVVRAYAAVKERRHETASLEQVIAESAGVDAEMAQMAEDELAALEETTPAREERSRISCSPRTRRTTPG